MKPNKSYLLFLSFWLLLAAGCSKILDKTPQDKFSDATVFSDINLADRYLLDTYNNSLSGDFGFVGFASLTDESHDTHGFETANYLQGNISSSSTGPFGSWINSMTWPSMYATIQKLNVFLANIDKVPEAYPAAQQAGV